MVDLFLSLVTCGQTFAPIGPDLPDGEGSGHGQHEECQRQKPVGEEKRDFELVRTLVAQHFDRPEFFKGLIACPAQQQGIKHRQQRRHDVKSLADRRWKQVDQHVDANVYAFAEHVTHAEENEKQEDVKRQLQTPNAGLESKDFTAEEAANDDSKKSDGGHGGQHVGHDGFFNPYYPTPD